MQNVGFGQVAMASRLGDETGAVVVAEGRTAASSTRAIGAGSVCVLVNTGESDRE